METEGKFNKTGRIPISIWVLAGVGMAGGALGLLLLALHRGQAQDVGAVAGIQREQVTTIAVAVDQSIESLEDGRARWFGDSSEGQPIIDTENLHRALALTQSSELPNELGRRVLALRSELNQVRDHLTDCAAWRGKFGPLTRKRDTSRDRAESAARSLHDQVDTLLRRQLVALHARTEHAPQVGGTPAPPEMATVELRDGLHDVSRLILRIDQTSQPRQLTELRDHEIDRTLAFATARVDAVRAQHSVDLQAPLETVRHQLLGADGQLGLFGAQMQWLRHRERGRQLEHSLTVHIDGLRDTRLEIERLAGGEAVAANQLVTGIMGRLWMLSVAIGFICAIALAWLARAYSRRIGAHIQRLHAARKTAAESLRAQGLFLANMSHEIRTPMNGVLGMAEMLETSPLGFEQKQIARTIRSSAEALLTVINDVLDFSKIQAGKLELDAADFDLRNTLLDAADLVRHMAERKGLELFCDIDHTVPRYVRGDSDRLRQILLNLAGNAIKFTEEGQVTILVELLNLHRDVVKLQVSVSDTGVGIPLDAQDKLFKPFTQADSSTTRRFGGTGLGLTISKRLIQMMEGDITVESTPAVGTTFSFTVNLQPAHRIEPKDDPTDLSGQAVLVVGRDGEAESVATQLAQWRTGFDLAENTDEALARLRHARRNGHRFDIALLDIDHEDGGLDLARRIANDPELARTRCVLMSREEPTDRSLHDLHLHGWISKPVSDPELKECLQNVLELTPTASRPTHDAEARDEFEERLGHHVLVAEDNAINQRVLRQMLEAIGCTAELAIDGREAVECMGASDFDVVLMDCQMPEMDGFEATAAIRQLDGPKSQVPIIALTANVLPADRRACEQAGMNDFLSKPFKKEQLRQIIAKWASVAALRA